MKKRGGKRSLTGVRKSATGACCQLVDDGAAVAVGLVSSAEAPEKLSGKLTRRDGHAVWPMGSGLEVSDHDTENGKVLYRAECYYAPTLNTPFTAMPLPAGPSPWNAVRES